MKTCKINAALAGYAQADYSPENWTLLNNAKMIGDTNIDNAISVTDVITALNNAEAAMAAVKTLLDDAKAAAHTRLDAVLTGYAQADYSPENWTILINAMTKCDTNNAASVADVTIALIDAEAAMAAVNTLLADAKIATHTCLNTALAVCAQDDYTTDNWTALTGFKTAGDTAIDAATDLAGVEAAQSAATTGMDGVQTIAQTLAAAKTAANEILTTALGTYTESNYTADNWTALTGYKTTGDTAIDTATDLAGVEAAQTAATTGMDGVQTITQTLTAAKTTANETLTTALGTYTESNYTADNWTALIGFKTAGETTIDAATDLAGVEAAQTAATTGMNGVLTIAQTLAVAKTAAHDALAAALETYTECNNTVDSGVALTESKVTDDTATDAAKVIDQIEALPSVDSLTLATGAEEADADTAYDIPTASQEGLGTNSSTLNETEVNIADLEPTL